MKTEFLILVPTKDAFATTKETFISILKGSTDILIDNEQVIKLKDASEQGVFKLSIETGRVKNNDKFCYHHLTISSTVGNPIVQLEKLNRIIKKTANIIKDSHIKIIWDDVAYHYSAEIYPKINEIENLMRLLISKFMYINIGVSWDDETLSEKLKSDAKSRNVEHFETILHGLDFTKLSDYLFKSFQRGVINEEIVRDLEVLKAEDVIQRLKQIYPPSNWDQYFREIMNIDSKSLSYNWDKIYEIRNKVAHNRLLDTSDYNQFNKIYDEMRAILTNAVAKLSEVEIPENVATELAEQAIQYKNEDLYRHAPISEQEFIENLELALDWAKRKGLGYISKYHFVVNILGRKGYEYASSNSVIEKLIADGKIRISLFDDGVRPKVECIELIGS